MGGAVGRFPSRRSARMCRLCWSWNTPSARTASNAASVTMRPSCACTIAASGFTTRSTASDKAKGAVVSPGAVLLPVTTMVSHQPSAHCSSTRGSRRRPASTQPTGSTQPTTAAMRTRPRTSASGCSMIACSTVATGTNPAVTTSTRRATVSLPGLPLARTVSTLATADASCSCSLAGLKSIPAATSVRSTSHCTVSLVRATSDALTRALPAPGTPVSTVTATSPPGVLSRVSSPSEVLPTVASPPGVLSRVSSPPGVRRWATAVCSAVHTACAVWLLSSTADRRSGTPPPSHGAAPIGTTDVGHRTRTAALRANVVTADT
eukprot:m.1042955 g.1042955  ORF g.1042955 m.1042955 type:complete len:321 (+) comp24163_c0_seq1:1079-2041(+)